MSTILYELPDRYVLDTGQVVGKHVRAVRDVLAGTRLDGQLYVDSEDLRRFASAQNQTPVLWSSGGPGVPDPTTREWMIPVEYQTIDLHDWLRSRLIEYLTEHDQFDPVIYSNRFDQEWALIETKAMTGLIQSLVYMVDVFRANNVVWGVGRGSSVESLILFLIGVHQIDPVQHGVDLEHFFR